MAKDENIKVIGINDFYTVAGYSDWSEGCQKLGLLPLFNIEVIGLNAEDQAAGIKVNDPSNPGRTYMSGKGLITSELPTEVTEWLEKAIVDNNRQSEVMTGLLNRLLKKIGAPFTLDFPHILSLLSRGQVRERHLALALRLDIEQHFHDEKERLDFYLTLTGKKPSSTDNASLENILRSSLMKAGGPAFIPEDPASFASLETIRQLLLKAGGIPTYPFLGDALNGQCTDFEKELPKTMQLLKQRGIYSVEFITTRNSIEYLEKAASELWENDFLVTFGTEHNTPVMEPLEPMAMGGKKLTPVLQMINVKSVCILLAHQFLTEKTGEGWLDNKTGKPKLKEKEDFIEKGWKMIAER